MYYAVKKDHIELYVFAKPNAKKNSIIRILNDELHVSLHARPIEGDANRVLLEFLSEIFKIPKSTLKILRGEHSRHKVIKIPLASIDSLIALPRQLHC